MKFGKKKLLGILTFALCVSAAGALGGCADIYGSGNRLSDGFSFALNEDGQSYTLVGSYKALGDTVNIPSSFDGKPVTAIGNGAFYDGMLDSYFTVVTIPDSVTTIGAQAFASCSYLTNVVFGSGVTEIGDEAFSGCVSLESLDLPDSVTTIGELAFNNCDALTAVTIPSNVTSFGAEVFNGCDRLVEIYNKSSLPLTNGNDDDYGYNYNYNENYTINVRNLYTPTKGASKLTTEGDFVIYTETYEYEDHDNEKDGFSFVQNTQKYVVAYKGTETDIVLPSDITGVYSYAFAKGEWTNDYNMKQANLTSVTIPANVEYIDSEAFRGCFALAEVYNYSNLELELGSKDNGYVAAYAKAIYTSKTDSKVTTDKDGYILYTDGADRVLLGYTGKETELILPDGVTEINAYAFFNQYALTSVTIPDSVTTIGNKAFYGCEKLQKLSLPSGITYFGDNVFTQLTQASFTYYKGGLYLGNDQNPYVFLWETMSDLVKEVVIHPDTKVIYSCDLPSSQTSIAIPEGVTVIGTSAFYGEKLTSIVIPSTVKVIGADAFGYTELTSIDIPESVTWIGNNAFTNCSGLTSVTIPATVKYIGSGAFTDCDNLTSVTIGAAEIGDNAFANCDQLESVTLGDGVESVGEYAFAHSNRLTSVTIGKNVTKIEAFAFSYCRNLVTIQFNGTTAEWNALEKENGWDEYTGKYTVECTDGTVDKVENESNYDPYENYDWDNEEGYTNEY